MVLNRLDASKYSVLVLNMSAQVSSGNHSSENVGRLSSHPACWIYTRTSPDGQHLGCMVTYGYGHQGYGQYMVPNIDPIRNKSYIDLMQIPVNVNLKTNQPLGGFCPKRNTKKTKILYQTIFTVANRSFTSLFRICSSVNG